MDCEPDVVDEPYDEVDEGNHAPSVGTVWVDLTTDLEMQYED